MSEPFSKRMAYAHAPDHLVALQSEAPRPALVLVDYEPPRLVRPVAIKVSAAAGDLYNVAYEKQVGAFIHQGVVDAHAWNEKWHPMAGLLDRSSGAKNPSPEDSDSSHDSTIRMVLAQPRDTNKRKSQEYQQKPHEVTDRPQLIRPIALRVQRPQPQRHVIPTDIAHPHNHRDACLSPLSVPSADLSIQSGKISEAPSQTQRSVTNQASSAHWIPPEHGQTFSNHRPTPTHIIIRQPSPSTSIQIAVRDARDGVLKSLASQRGETVGNAELLAHLDFLKQHYAATRTSPHAELEASRGLWLSLTKPLFFGSLGETDEGDPLYTLGRMSFDMFSPTSLVCSLQGSFNEVTLVGDRSHDEHLIVPKSLKEEVEKGDSKLQTHNIVTAFTIECDSTEERTPNKDVHRAIKGIMTTYGYTLPDPKCPSRQSVWITGGRIEPNNNQSDQANWKQLFSLHPPSKSLGEQAKFLAVKLLMGATMPSEMNADGSMEYVFTRPIGGHGTAYVDTLYVDKTLRIVQGHRGTIFVFSRMHE